MEKHGIIWNSDFLGRARANHPHVTTPFGYATCRTRSSSPVGKGHVFEALAEPATMIGQMVEKPNKLGLDGVLDRAAGTADADGMKLSPTST